MALTSANPRQALQNVRVVGLVNGTELFGHERGNIEVFKALRDLGAAVIIGVNTRDGGGAVAAELRGLGFELFGLPFGPQWSKAFVRAKPSLVLSNPLAVLRCSWELSRIVKRFSPTHVHIGSPLVYSYVSLALARNAVPLVYRMGDCPPRDSLFNFLIWKRAVRRSVVLVANSTFVESQAILAGAPSSRLRVIYNVAPSSGSTSSRPEADEPPRSSCRMIYAGAVARHKGLVPLVEAVAALRTHRPTVKLDVFGQSAWDGSFRNELTELIGARQLARDVILRGHVEDPAPHFRRAAVHVAPSLWEEPAANVVLEAKREGTPSVVFPSGGLPELVRHRVDGYVCSEKSAAALAEALDWMFSDEPRLLAMGAAAQEDYRNRFGPERFARQWQEAYGAVS